jgi:hypothetical protein
MMLKNALTVSGFVSGWDFKHNFPALCQEEWRFKNVKNFPTKR